MFCVCGQYIAFYQGVDTADELPSASGDGVASLQEKPWVEAIQALLHELKAMLLTFNTLSA